MFCAPLWCCVTVSVSKFKDLSVFFPVLLLSVGTESLHPCKLPSCQDIQLVTHWELGKGSSSLGDMDRLNRYFLTNADAIYIHFYLDHETISSKQGTTLGSTSVRNLFAMIGPSVDTLRMWGMSEIPYTQTLCRHLPWHVRLLQAQVARTIGSDIQDRRCLTMYPDSGLQSILSIIVRVWRKCSSVCPLSRLQSRKILLTGWESRNHIQYLSRIPLLCPL